MIESADLQKILESKSNGSLIINNVRRNIAWAATQPHQIEIWVYNPSQMSLLIVSYVFTIDEICKLINNQLVQNNLFTARIGYRNW